MKARLLPLFLSYWLIGCTVNRYYFIAEDPIELYDSPTFSGGPVLTALPGDTVSATGTRHPQLGGAIPVEYKGYRFYAPSARAQLARVVKIRLRQDTFEPGIVYTSRMRYEKYSGLPSDYGNTAAAEPINQTAKKASTSRSTTNRTKGKDKPR